MFQNASAINILALIYSTQPEYYTHKSFGVKVSAQLLRNDLIADDLSEIALLQIETHKSSSYLHK